jgi:hemoglobin/transferrin/lactoferrin receptor protein
LDLAAWWRVSKQLTLRLGLHNLTDDRTWRYGSVRGVSATNISEQQRRTEPGLNATLSARLTF